GAHSARAADPVYGGCVDNCPPSGRLHDTSNVFETEKGPFYVDAEYPVEIRFGDIFEATEMDDAGIVDQRVDASVAFHQSCNQFLPLGLDGHVEWVKQCAV